MGWNRQQFRKERKVVRRSRVRLSAAHCVECGCELSASHLVHRFGEQCRACWQMFIGSVSEGEGLSVGR